MTPIRIGVAAAMALALTACATKPKTDGPATFFAQNFQCSASGSTTVDMKRLQHSPEAYANKCVHVVAFASGRSMFADATEMGSPHPPPIELYWKDKDIAMRLHRGPSFVDVVGRFQACKEVYRQSTLSADATNAKYAKKPKPSGGYDYVAIPFIGGYCHYVDGYALYVSEYRLLPTAMD
jgi:hypothetical protein